MILVKMDYSFVIEVKPILEPDPQSVPLIFMQFNNSLFFQICYILNMVSCDLILHSIRLFQFLVFSLSEYTSARHVCFLKSVCIHSFVQVTHYTLQYTLHIINTHYNALSTALRAAHGNCKTAKLTAPQWKNTVGFLSSQLCHFLPEQPA